MGTLRSINPATEEVVSSREEMTDAELASIAERAASSVAEWQSRSFSERSEILKRAASFLTASAEEQAILMALEMGKPVSQGTGEISKCAGVCEYYADNAERMLADDPAPSDASRSYVAYQPLGAILAIMPWNFPFWQVFRFAAPALMAGNAAVLKHASNVSGCALAIEKVFHEAGVPRDVFRTVLAGSSRIPQLIEHPGIRAVTLTGSTPAGRSVAGHAGRSLKKTVLELGGSDAYLVLQDADVELAAETCVRSRTINSGQSCIAAKRFIVSDSVLEEFTSSFVEKMRALRIGDPLEKSTEVGPLARVDLREELHRQVSETVTAGGRLLLGGKMPEGRGAFYPPTVLGDVRPGMAAFDEELFGPVGAIIGFGSEDEAVGMANHCEFGLGAAVFTRDVERGERIARKIEAGCCFVNDFVRSDPKLPFGGIKNSGYGRELSHFGIREFVNIKTIYIK